MRTIPVRDATTWEKTEMPATRSYNEEGAERHISQPPLTRQAKNFFDQPGRCQCPEREVVIRIRDDAVEQ
jgi:hypothetical protein